MTQLVHQGMQIPTRPPLRYHGGKWRLAPWIIKHMPEHRTYVEVFGGAAGVLLRKPRVKAEVYNDLDDQVVNFFSCLRDRTEELCRLVGLTPFSRTEFANAHKASDDSLEAARRFVTRCYMGHGTSSMNPTDANGFRSCDVRAGKAYGDEWSGIPLAISKAAERFKAVSIENLHFLKLIPKFDHVDTLYYCDPPYPLSTRKNGGKGYVHEMSEMDHRDLAWLLKQCKGKILVSSYPSKLYDALYSDWWREEKSVQANGQRGAVRRVEVLYMNFEPPPHLLADSVGKVPPSVATAQNHDSAPLLEALETNRDGKKAKRRV